MLANHKAALSELSVVLDAFEPESVDKARILQVQKTLNVTIEELRSRHTNME